MLTVLVLSLVGLQPPLAHLGYERAALEEALRRAKGERGPYLSSSPSFGSSGTYTAAYYPEGVSSHRYLYDDAHSLSLQTLKGGRVKTEWTITLKDLKGQASKGGTLRRMLNSGRYQPAGRLSKAQKASLDAERAFAVYVESPFEGPLYAHFIRRDGTESPTDVVSPCPLYAKRSFLPVLADEAVALDLGNRRWVGPGKFDIRHPVP